MAMPLRKAANLAGSQVSAIIAALPALDALAEQLNRQAQHLSFDRSVRS
jgi:hypothetical protein